MAIVHFGYNRRVANDDEPADRRDPNRIRELREMHGISQAELARRINVTASALNKVELGSRRLDLDWMRRVARALDCAPADLLLIEDNPMHLNDEERRMLEAFRRAPDRDQAAFIRVADALIPFRADEAA